MKNITAADLVFWIGLIMVGVGISFKYDWDVSLMICGSIMLTIGLLGAIRR